MATSEPDRRGILVAASQVETSTVREAAILGGIVRSALDDGLVDTEGVGTHVCDALAEFNLVNVDRRRPGAVEVGIVLERLERRFGHRLTPD